MSGLKGSIKKTQTQHDPMLDKVKGVAASEDRTQVNVYLPKRLQRELKIQAAVEDCPMSAIVERVLTKYLEEIRKDPSMIDR